VRSSTRDQKLVLHKKVTSNSAVETKNIRTEIVLKDKIERNFPILSNELRKLKNFFFKVTPLAYPWQSFWVLKIKKKILHMRKVKNVFQQSDSYSK
jgi:hypothetical protein